MSNIASEKGGACGTISSTPTITVIVTVTPGAKEGELFLGGKKNEA